MAVTNTRDAVQNVQFMHGINIGVVINLLSMSVQHMVDFHPLRLSSKGQCYNVPGMFKWCKGAVRLTFSDFRITW